MLTREKILDVIASELEASEGLPPNASQHLCDIREGKKIGPGIEAMVRAVRRCIILEEAK